jgi:hypothetical protein
VSLYKVISGWTGNGREGVLVEAKDVVEAKRAARDVLLADAKEQLKTARGVMADHEEERIASYLDEPEQFRAVELTLPHKDEFG